MEDEKSYSDKLEQVLRDADQRIKAAAEMSANLAPERERRVALETRLDALPEAERRKAYDELGLPYVPAIPKLMERIRDSAPFPKLGTRAAPRSKPIDWKYWRHLPKVKQSEACALSMNINPDDMKPHREGWMTGSGSGPIFTDDSFPNGAKDAFYKRLRWLGASLFSSGFFPTLNDLSIGGAHNVTISIREFAAWCVHVELEDVPPELIALAEIKTALEPLPTETKTEREDRRLKACVDAGLPMSAPASLLRLPDGVGEVADSEGVSRQTFSTDVKAALSRGVIARRAG